MKRITKEGRVYWTDEWDTHLRDDFPCNIDENGAVGLCNRNRLQHRVITPDGVIHPEGKRWTLDEEDES